MAPAVAAALLSLVPTAIKGAQGISQKKKAKQIQVGDRKVSDRLKRVEKDYATRATSSKFAGQSRVEENIDQTSANILEKAKDAASPNEYLSMVAKQGGSLQDKQLEIGKLALTDKQRRQDDASAASINLGAEETRIREANIGDQRAAKSALNTAGDTNIAGAASDAAGVAATLATSKAKAGTTSPTTGEKSGSKKVKTQAEIDAEEEALRRIKYNRPL